MIAGGKGTLLIAGGHLHGGVEKMRMLREPSRRDRVETTGWFEVGTFDEVARRVVQIRRNIGLELSSRIFFFRFFLRELFVTLLLLFNFLLNWLLFFYVCFPVEEVEFLLAFLFLSLRVFILYLDIFAALFLDVLGALRIFFWNLNLAGRLFDFLLEVRML